MRGKQQHGTVALPAILLFLCGGVQLVCGVRFDDVDDVNDVYDATEVEEADTKAAEKHPIAIDEAVATAASVVRRAASAVAKAVSKVNVAPDALPFAGTSLVLRTFGGFRPFNTYLLCRYLEQLDGTGIELAVLHDMADQGRQSSLMQDDRTEDDSSPKSEELRDDDRTEDGGGTDLDQEDGDSSSEDMRAVEHEYDAKTGNGAVKAYCPKRGMVRVPLCRVTWQMVKDKFPGKEYLDRFENWGPHELTDLFLTHWWNQCSPRLTSPQERVWFVEPDAFFNGNVMDFLGAYGNSSADLIGAGFRIAGKAWFKWVGYTEAHTEKFRTFKNDDASLITNVPVLPTLLDYDCNAGFNWGGTDTEGVIFFQDTVMRLSKHLLNALSGLFDEGLVAPSESFVATACASQIGFGCNHSKATCTMQDFAPLAERASGKTWASPDYCWAPRYDWLKHRHCEDKAWGNKWIHPVKANTAGAMVCPDDLK